MFVALLIIAGLVCLWFAVDSYREEGFKLAIPTFIIPAGICYFFISMAALIVEDFASPEETRYVNIYSMGDGLGSEGRGGFFGGFGSIDSEAVFMYYTKDGEYYKLRHVDADRVKIVQTDEGQPRYEKQCGNSADLAGWLRMPFWDYDSIICDSYSDLTFFVPEGSIKQQFNLDAN